MTVLPEGPQEIYFPVSRADQSPWRIWKRGTGESFGGLRSTVCVVLEGWASCVLGIEVG